MPTTAPASWSRSGRIPTSGGSGSARRSAASLSRRLEEEGATQAVVYAIADDPEHPGPEALYESIGFVEASRFVRYVADLA